DLQQGDQPVGDRSQREGEGVQAARLVWRGYREYEGLGVISHKDTETQRRCLVVSVSLCHPPTVSPPSAGSTTPVMKLESASDAKKTYAGAISSGCAGRSSGVFLPNSATLSGGAASSTALSGVHTRPGATQLTRMPRFTSFW